MPVPARRRSSSAAEKPLAVAAASPPVWSTTVTVGGFYVGLDDGTVQLVDGGNGQIVAGQSGTHCTSLTSPSSACGDAGPPRAPCSEPRPG